MAKRRKEDLESLRDFCDRSYSGAYGSKLLVNTEKQFDPKHFDLGYCYKFTEDGKSIYQIVCAQLGIPYTDFRVMMHEYGHIYLGHLDGIHEQLDQRICTLFQDRRNELVESLNEKLGIDFASSLIDRVIDDPQLNHSLHNIAMDMEVNSSVLSEEDIDEMEKDISSTYPKYSKELQDYLKEHDEITDEQKKQLEDLVKKMDDAVKVKLILPCRYEISEGVPFPDDLTYPDYLLLIVQHLDQFVKMLVSLRMGKGLNGNVSLDDIRNMLNNPKRDWKNATKEYKQGYQDALNDLRNGNQRQQNRPQQGQGNQQGQQGQPMNMPGAGVPGQGQPGQGNNGSMSPGNAQGGQQPMQGQGQGVDVDPQNQGSSQGQGYDPQAEYDRGYQDALNDAAGNGQGQGQGDPLSQLLGDFFGDKDGGLAGNLGPWQDKPEHYTERRGIRDLDHNTKSREEADRKREVGQIKAGGGVSCGDRGGPDVTREVDKEADAVDMALNEVIRNMRHRVIKLDTKKDLMRNYNRGIVRSVIAPAVMRKVTVSNEQKIVYLIDISGSMDTALVDRILKAIKRNMMHLSKGLKYDIITWSTHLGEHMKDINPRRPVPRISYGGGTSIAGGIQYFKENYGPEATLIIISDFEDNLEEWNEVEKKMSSYLIYGFNYGSNRWGRSSEDIPWKNLRLKNFYDKTGN